MERYTETWQRVDAVFGRLDLDNVSELNKRLRGKGGFCIGDGDPAGRRKYSDITQTLSFVPLRLPGDPPTPPPSPTPPKARAKSNIPANNLPRNRRHKHWNRNKTVDSDDLSPKQRQSNRMTMSLAAEFGIDDTTYDFNDLRESFYGIKKSNNPSLITLI